MPIPIRKFISNPPKPVTRCRITIHPRFPKLTSTAHNILRSSTNTSIYTTMDMGTQTIMESRLSEVQQRLQCLRAVDLTDQREIVCAKLAILAVREK